MKYIKCFLSLSSLLFAMALPLTANYVSPADQSFNDIIAKYPPIFLSLDPSEDISCLEALRVHFSPVEAKPSFVLGCESLSKRWTYQECAIEGHTTVSVRYRDVSGAFHNAGSFPLTPSEHFFKARGKTVRLKIELRPNAVKVADSGSWCNAPGSTLWQKLFDCAPSDNFYPTYSHANTYMVSLDFID